MATIEDVIKESLKNKTASLLAVETLVNVRTKAKDSEDFGSDVELKTDLSEREVIVHSLLDEISRILNMTPAEFKQDIVVPKMVERKERKLLSKNRKSREEVVRVAKPEDTEQQQRGFLSRLFSPKPIETK